MSSLAAALWPLADASDALAALASAHGIKLESVDIPRPTFALDTPGRRRTWIETAAEWLGTEAFWANTRHGDIRRVLRQGAPLLTVVHTGGQSGWLAVTGRRGESLRCVAPGLRTTSVRLDDAISATRADAETVARAEAETLASEAGLTGRAHERAVRALIDENLRAERCGEVWQLRRTAAVSAWQWVKQAGIPKRITQLFALHALQTAVWVLSWTALGSAALQGRIDLGWMAGWVLLLITLAPLRSWSTWLQGRLAIEAGGKMRERLLAGALRLEPDEVREEGSGRLLGRVLEAESIEVLALSGGIQALTASVEVLAAGFVLAAGASPALHVVLLTLWTAGFLYWARTFHRRFRAWTAVRMEQTHHLVEQMAGHRTRIAQQDPADWHLGEDERLAQYVDASRSMDRMTALFNGLLPRTWLVAGLIALTPAFVETSGASSAFAISLGGILLAYRAFRSFGMGAGQIAAAAASWEWVKPLFNAAARRPAIAPPNASAELDAQANPGGEAVIDAADITYRYPTRPDPVLHGLSVRIAEGERILVSGTSGGGKSTLMALLSGMRQPDTGLLLLRGFDRPTLGGDAWRKRVVAAPQFHENHVLTGTFGFNAFMGPGWPPSREDYARTQQICRELGLGDLLDRMPGGIDQTVGDTGWQLSHGEKSRLYIARTLLQNPDVVILDENFAALDPDNLKQAMECALKHAKTLVVVAHV